MPPNANFVHENKFYWDAERSFKMFCPYTQSNEATHECLGITESSTGTLAFVNKKRVEPLPSLCNSACCQAQLDHLRMSPGADTVTTINRPCSNGEEMLQKPYGKHPAAVQNIIDVLRLSAAELCRVPLGMGEIPAYERTLWFWENKSRPIQKVNNCGPYVLRTDFGTSYGISNEYIIHYVVRCKYDKQWTNGH